MSLSPGPQGSVNEPGAGERPVFPRNESRASGDSPYEEYRNQDRRASSGGRSEDGLLHPHPPPSPKSSSEERILKLERDLQESEARAKLWREQADESRMQWVTSLTEAGILKRDLEAARERLRQFEAQASQPSSSASSLKRASLGPEAAMSRIDQRILESLRAREIALMDEVKALQDELEAVKQQLWDAEQSSGEARLLKQQLESTQERLQQLEETQDGLATNPWSTGSNRSIYQERRSSIDTMISSTSGSRAQMLAQEVELKATKRELSAVKQQLNDAVTLASSQTRMGELRIAGSSQTFLMQADNSSAVDVIQKVNAVNEEIFQVAAYLGEVLFYEVLTPGGDRQEHRQRAINASYEGAKNMLGDKLANALAQASVKEPKDEINPLLVQIVMQIALTNWCGILGRRWTSFKKVDRASSGGGARRDQQRDSANNAGVSSQVDYDKFISELYDRIRDHEDQNIAGRWRSITRAHVPFSTNGWDRSLMSGICSIMVACGWVTRSDAELAQIENRLASIFKPLLDLRKATGEEITSADVDIALVRPGEALNPAYMEDAYPGERSQSKPKRRNSGADLVAGTTGLGLQRLAVRRLESGGVQRQSERFLTLPKVVLEKTIMEALESAPPPRKPKKKNTRDSMGPGPRGPGVFGVMFGLKNEAQHNINRRQPGSPSNGIPADFRSATFGARDALYHIDTHKDDILESLGVQQAFVLAGFNEDYVQEGIGLLQEIQILACKDLELDESALAGVGKACSPFPSVVFLPSGKRFQPPLYDQDGKDVPFSALGDSVCKLRYSLAIDKGLSLAEETIGGTVTSHHATSGNVPTSEDALPTSNRSGGVAPAGTGQTAISNQSTSVEEGERGTSHPQNSTQGGRARESPSQRIDPDALPQDPPEPDNGTATERLRNIYLELRLAIQRSDSEKDVSPEQNIQLLANFGFQLDRGKSATVKFTELACSEATPSSKQHQAHYLHRYLKVLVDPQSQKWRASHCSPKRTPAGQREIKDITTAKDSRQYGTKLKAALAPSASLEGGSALENSKAREWVQFTSGIMQKKSAEGYTWGFEVDDAREQQQGLQLSDDKLPSLSLVYLPDARQSYNSDIPEELTVEISAFWSLGLPTRSNGWLSFSNLMLQGQYIPKFSNFVHSVRVDLRADMDCDGHFVGEQKVGGGIPERREVDTQSQDMLLTTGIQSIGDRHPEDVPRWLPKQDSK